MNYEQYDELLRQKKDLESILRELHESYCMELTKLLDIKEQIKEMENGR